MEYDRVKELEDLALAPRGEMAVVADTDAADDWFAGSDESVPDDDMPDTIPDPRSMPFVPHVRISTRPPPSSPRERFFEDEAAPPSV